MNVSNDPTANVTSDVSSIEWSTHDASLSTLKIQINDYDTYQSYPSKLDQLYTKVSQVPVIRIYGSVSVGHENKQHTNSARKKCKIGESAGASAAAAAAASSLSVFNIIIHVHNFYPYFYVDCQDTDYEKLQSPEYINEVIEFLENVMRASFKKRRGRKGTEEQELELEEDAEEDAEEAEAEAEVRVQTTSSLRNAKLRRYIANVSICKAVPIYGFQLGYKLCYKISLLSPLYKNRLARMFQENKISLVDFNKVSSPVTLQQEEEEEEVKEEKKSNKKPSYSYTYEVHIPFLLQFLTDYNLFGCGWLYVDRDAAGFGPQTRALYFRTPIFTETLKNVYTPAQLSSLTKFLGKFILPDNVLVDGGNYQSFKRMGKSMLEVDITTNGIINRSWLTPRELHDDFTERENFKSYKADLELFGFPKHGYKHELDGSPKIYLSSLKHIYNDLKYQCRLKNSTYDVSVDVLESSTRSYFGNGTTKWSNQGQLDELLEFMIFVNGESKYDFGNFASKVIKSSKSDKIGIINEFPTSFNLVDIEKRHQLHKHRMIFGDDILIWGEYNDIFKLSQRHKSLASSPLQNGSQQFEMNLPLLESDGEKDSEEMELESVEDEDEDEGEDEGEDVEEVSDEDADEDADEDVDANNRVDANNGVDEQKHPNPDVLRASTDEGTTPEPLPSCIKKHDNSVSPSSQLNLTDESTLPGNNDEDEMKDYESAEEFDAAVVRSMTMTMAMTQAKSQIETRKNTSDASDLMSSLDNFLSTPNPTSNTFPILKNLEIGPNMYNVKVPFELRKGNCKSVFESSGTSEINYTDPFYYMADDLPSRPFIFANQKIKPPVKNKSTIPTINLIRSEDLEPPKSVPTMDRVATWQYLPTAPSKKAITSWLVEEEAKNIKKQQRYRSQIEVGTTQWNDFKYSYNSEKVARKPDEFNYLTCFHMEIHANPPNSKLSVDPLRDPIIFIFYSFDDANGMFDSFNYRSGVLVYNNQKLKVDLLQRLGKLLGQHIDIFEDEQKMVARLVELVEIFDPDILSGYEVNALSWGYIVERCRGVFDTNILSDLSRGSHRSNGKMGDKWGYTHTANIEINGRHVLNVWRILKSDMALTSYTLENVCYHLLHRSLPRYSPHQLSSWIQSDNFQNLYVVISYFVERVRLTLKIIEVQELITRNVEHSRLIGIEFNSNFYRGSQYKVESILARITKSENLLLNSPSKYQVHEMRPIECIPLVMEPRSNFYKSPLVVLDFQSLYPSIMIAYNYCFSTIIGKLHNFKSNKNNIGYLKNLNLPSGIIDLLKNDDAINVSPNGFAFVKSSVRKSVLAKMLEEILNIRLKTKHVMKLFGDDTELKKLYNSRQTALKLIANVTYGYASATFSGRMPNPDIADAIVSSGREILEKSVELIENGGHGAKVVYGDTDSLFVYFPGKSKAEAFKSGREIAKIVTDYFPDPIKLQFEKVYHPCVLLAKKRYVGYSFESETQEMPKFDAKGIETVRRDGIPAQQKVTEKALRILFETQNLSKVKNYTLKQFYKIMTNKISINDFCFAKAVKYGAYKDERYLPPGALLASKAVEEDPRKEPQYKERIPYVVVRDPTKTRIKDRVMFPEDFISSFSTIKPLMLDYEYYITRVLIPPLERIFNLMGADVRGWYNQMPKMTKNNLTNPYNDSCLVCGSRLDGSQYICSKCSHDPQQLATDLMMTCKSSQQKLVAHENTCKNCVHGIFLPGGSMPQYTNNCTNRDCTVYFNKVKTEQEMRSVINKKDKILEELKW
ncbi:uncharacterized protein LODBEIA_P33590 [Lodderomyces beijingensis]|uniref:DNA polymerase n=1 Tax=Lodderomyces beijingensis TaxID=1775926 RepID=A0ABP0ZSE6_9ASCO